MIANENNKTTQTLDRNLIVQNKMGIHARPAALIVRIANTYTGEVWVKKDDEQVNGKSIMGLMMLAAGKNSKLTIKIEGPVDTGKKMLDKLEELFVRKFEED